MLSKNTLKRIGVGGIHRLPSRIRAVTADVVENANAVGRRRAFLEIAADTIRKVEQGAGLRDAPGTELNREVMDSLNRVVKAWTSLRAEIKRRLSEVR